MRCRVCRRIVCHDLIRIISKDQWHKDEVGNLWSAWRFLPVNRKVQNIKQLPFISPHQSRTHWKLVLVLFFMTQLLCMHIWEQIPKKKAPTVHSQGIDKFPLKSFYKWIGKKTFTHTFTIIILHIWYCVYEHLVQFNSWLELTGWMNSLL